MPHMALLLEGLDHLKLRRIRVLKGLLIELLSLLVFLIPAPFVDLTFSEAASVADSYNRFFAPVGVLKVLLHEVVHLSRVLTVSLLFVCSS